MKNQILISLLLCIMPCLIMAKSKDDEIKDKTDSIKLDAAYIYAEAFGDANWAFENALINLTASANEIRQGRGMPQITDQELKPKASELQYTRRGRLTVFLYISIEEMLKIGKAEAAAEPAPAIPPKPTQPAQPAAGAFSAEALRSIAIQDNWIEVKGILSSMKKSGKLKENGTCKSPGEVPDDAYSLLIDDMQGIIALLTPKKMGPQKNLKTNRPAQESDFTNCKAIVWFK